MVGHTYTIRPVPSYEAEEAHAFHRQQAEINQDFLLPRSLDDLRNLAEEGYLFSVRREGQIVALCYMTPGHEADAEVWEFGGVTVAETERGHALGVCLGSFALATILITQDPWGQDPPQEVIAHVHVNNSAPRKLLERDLRFSHTDRNVYPRSLFPDDCRMITNEDGDIEGDVFLWPCEALWSLRDWFDGFFGQWRGNQVVFEHPQFPVNLVPQFRALLTSIGEDYCGGMPPA